MLSLPSVQGQRPVPSSASAISWRVVEDISNLDAIFNPEISIALLRRKPSPELLSEVVRARTDYGFPEVVEIWPAAGARDMSDVFQGFSHVASDVSNWAELLGEITGADRVGVRLHWVNSAMCPRFHVDHVTLRLVVTYQGPGTEFVSNEHVDRRYLGHASRGQADEVSGLLRSPACIQSAQTFDVVLLKGEAWPENRGRGAVHRSPHPDADGPRLILTLDAL
jgi:hypothetical protein